MKKNAESKIISVTRLSYCRIDGSRYNVTGRTTSKNLIYYHILHNMSIYDKLHKTTNLSRE